MRPKCCKTQVKDSLNRQLKSGAKAPKRDGVGFPIYRYGLRFPTGDLKTTPGFWIALWMHLLLPILWKKQLGAYT